MHSTLLVVLAIFLVFLNGFFVAAEFAIVKVRYSRIETLEEAQGFKGRLLGRIYREMDAYLSACQLGITLTSLALGWIGEPLVANLVRPGLALLGISSFVSIEVAAFSVAFFLISYLHIVFGELVPKSMAIRQAERVAIWTAIPLFTFYWVMFPIIYVLNLSARLPLILFRWDVAKHGEPAYSSEELVHILKASHLHGELTKTEAEMIEQTLEFADLQVSDVMGPLSELVALNDQESVEANLLKMAEHRFTRYPLYRGTIEHTFGVIHTKDIFAAKSQHRAIESLKFLARPLLRVDKRSSVLELLQEFREGGGHMALVFDQERLVGFVTLDDLMQVIVGNIRDEFKVTHQDWTVLGDQKFRLAVHASIYTIEHLASVDLTDYPASSVLELMAHQLGRLAQLGDQVDFPGFLLSVESMNDQQVKSIVLTLKPNRTTR